MLGKIAGTLNTPPETPVNKDEIALDFIQRHLSQNKADEPDCSDDAGLTELEHDGEYKRLEVEFLRLKVKRYKKDTKLRIKYAGRVYLFMVCYALFVAAVVLASSLPPSANLNGIPLKIQIGDVPLSTLIGAAFASAVGLVAFVVKGLFPHGRKFDET